MEFKAHSFINVPINRVFRLLCSRDFRFLCCALNGAGGRNYTRTHARTQSAEGKQAEEEKKYAVSNKKNTSDLWSNLPNESFFLEQF